MRTFWLMLGAIGIAAKCSHFQTPVNGVLLPTRALAAMMWEDWTNLPSDMEAPRVATPVMKFGPFTARN